jgi:hypothetical protein
MTGPRSVATATRLQNDQVLIVGGGPDDKGLSARVFASAELYDPATGKFSQTGSMAMARGGNTATLLQDGRVLIAGGGGCSDPKRCLDEGIDARTAETLSSAELYDPATGKFTRTGSMVEPRNGATATLLQDGRVLIASGGLNPMAELYNPATGMFTRTGSTLNIYNYATATLLPNGKVLLTGQVSEGTAAELYDPASGKFTQAPFMYAAGAAAPLYKGQTFDRQPADTSTLLNDGRVLLFETGYLETYDYRDGTFTPAGFVAPPGELFNPTAALLSDGDVLLVGGILEADLPYQVQAAAWLYDPVTGIHAISSMTTPRIEHTATLLQDGSVLITGGTADYQTTLSSAELFVP